MSAEPGELSGRVHADICRLDDLSVRACSTITEGAGHCTVCTRAYCPKALVCACKCIIHVTGMYCHDVCILLKMYVWYCLIIRL